MTPTQTPKKGARAQPISTRDRALHTGIANYVRKSGRGALYSIAAKIEQRPRLLLAMFLLGISKDCSAAQFNPQGRKKKR